MEILEDSQNELLDDSQDKFHKKLLKYWEKVIADDPQTECLKKNIYNKLVEDIQIEILGVTQK